MTATPDRAIEEPRSASAGSWILLAATVFTSAFLLFQVQPIISKFILPWFGSTPGVWATALLFFQLMLLGGYAYAHFIVSRLTWRRQAMLHSALLGLVLLTLPITPAASLKPTGADAPALGVLLILTLTVGAPYLLLSATAPLIQRWFAQLHPGRSPYRLYALSNVASLLALLSYPFLVEPYVRLQSQTSSWSLGYVVFAALCAGCALVLYRSIPDSDAAATPSGSANAAQDAEADDHPEWGEAALWILLSAVGSGLLLATTNQMSTDIAVVPFLWILPLSIYLLTFVLTFDHERWYVRPLFMALLPPALIGAVWLLWGGVDLAIEDQVMGYIAILFICCMCCHGELARSRPAPRHLTFFFLMVSIGGAVGGLFVAIIAPAIFPAHYEYHLLLNATYVLVGFVFARMLIRGEISFPANVVLKGLVGICWIVGLGAIVLATSRVLDPDQWLGDASSNAQRAFASWLAYMRVYGAAMAILVLVAMEAWRRSEKVGWRSWWASRRGMTRFGLVAVGTMGLYSLTGALLWQITNEERRMVAQDRNFYGTLAIKERNFGSREHQLSLTHGRIKHGSQLQIFPTWPTTYYGPETGVGLAMEFHPKRSDPSHQFRSGVVGLGIGTLAAYANVHVDLEEREEAYVTPRETDVPDYIRFYELNPLVVQWAWDRFSFLGDAVARGADVAVFEGDARIVLERQVEQGETQRFDVLAIDAFSSDAIPIHLLTMESVRIYLAHLEEDGILAFHVTNRYVDLLPIVSRLAAETGMSAIYVENYGSSSRDVSSSDWVLLTKNEAFLDLEVVHEDEEELPAPGPLWTDDFSSLWEIVEFGG